MTTGFEGNWAVLSLPIPEQKTVTIARKSTETKIREDKAKRTFSLGERMSWRSRLM